MIKLLDVIEYVIEFIFVIEMFIVNVFLGVSLYCLDWMVVLYGVSYVDCVVFGGVELELVGLCFEGGLRDKGWYDDKGCVFLYFRF